MARFAIVENKEVVNVIVADAQFIEENKINGVECDDIVSPGWKFIDGKFVSSEDIKKAFQSQPKTSEPAAPSAGTFVRVEKN